MDRDDFASRVRTMAPRMHRIAYLILRNESDCEDATQEALLRAWRRIHTLRQEQFFETWLIRILINECKRLIRRNIEARAAVSQRGEAEDSSVLYDAIGTLSDSQRLPILLHYIEGYSLSEIAGMLGVPVSTVKWRLYQGRKRLSVELTCEEANL